MRNHRKSWRNCNSQLPTHHIEQLIWPTPLFQEATEKKAELWKSERLAEPAALIVSKVPPLTKWAKKKGRGLYPLWGSDAYLFDVRGFIIYTVLIAFPDILEMVIELMKGQMKVFVEVPGLNDEQCFVAGMWLDKKDEHEKCVCMYTMPLYIYICIYNNTSHTDRLLLKQQDGSYVNVVWQPGKMTSEMTQSWSMWRWPPSPAWHRRGLRT